jgi:MinD-like ATPase involved in chromosome partitioning or flagellar assembly
LAEHDQGQPVGDTRGPGGQPEADTDLTAAEGGQGEPGGHDDGVFRWPASGQPRLFGQSPAAAAPPPPPAGTSADGTSADGGAADGGTVDTRAADTRAAETRTGPPAPSAPSAGWEQPPAVGEQPPASRDEPSAGWEQPPFPPRVTLAPQAPYPDAGPASPPGLAPARYGLPDGYDAIDDYDAVDAYGPPEGYDTGYGPPGGQAAAPPAPPASAAPAPGAGEVAAWGGPAATASGVWPRPAAAGNGGADAIPPAADDWDSAVASAPGLGPAAGPAASAPGPEVPGPGPEVPGPGPEVPGPGPVAPADAAWDQPPPVAAAPAEPGAWPWPASRVEAAPANGAGSPAAPAADENPPPAPGPYAAPAPGAGQQPLAPLPTELAPPRPAAETADSLTADLLLPGRHRAPAQGWRRLVYRSTGGLIRAPESAAEQRRRQLTARACTPVAGGHHRVAVLSLKGGVGKTTTAVGLGATLASLRGDRVIAVDANPDRGTLSDKLRLETAATVRDLLNERAQIQRYADVRAFTTQAPSRLEVLASDRDPTVSVAFSEADYLDVAAVLEHYYSICITDCGTGLLHSAMAGVLRLADQIVLVSSPSVDGARSASATLDWLAAHNYGKLVRGGVVVLSAVRPQGKTTVDITRLEQHFAARCRAVLRIPYDPHLAEGAEVDLGQLSKHTADAYLALAAEVGDGFAWSRRGRPAT